MRHLCKSLLIGLLAVLPLSAVAQKVALDFEGLATDNGKYLFAKPSRSASTNTFLQAPLDTSLVSSEKAFGGTNSLKINWQFKTGQATPWLRLITSNTGDSTARKNPTISFKGLVYMRMFIDGPDDLSVGLGVRESNATTALGEDAGNFGTIKWVGVTSSTGVNAPIGKQVKAGSWQLVVFDLTADPVRATDGTASTLNSSTGKGTFDHLAFTPLSNTKTGPYTVYIDDVSVVAPESVSGLAYPQESVSAMDVVATFLFQPQDGLPSFTRTALLASDGSFSLTGIQGNTYRVLIKTPRNLQKAVLLDMTSGNAIVNMTLPAGDVNGDNSVNLDDLGLLSDAFDTKPGDDLYNSDADLNYDGNVNLDDLGLLALNFDTDGDN